MGVIESVKLVYGYQMQPDDVKNNRVNFLSLAEKGQLGQPDEPFDMDLELRDFCNLSKDEWLYPFSFTEWLSTQTKLTAISPIAQYSDYPEEEMVYFGLELAECDPHETSEYAFATDLLYLENNLNWLRQIANELQIDQEPKLWLLLCYE